MKLILSPRAEKQLKKLPKFDQIAIAQKIRALQHYPVLGEEKLAGHTNFYRVRVGSYQIVYRKTSDSIYIVLIGHRRDVYRLLKELLR